MSSTRIALLLLAFLLTSLESLACIDVSRDLLKDFVSGQKLTTGVFQHQSLVSLRDCIKECWLQSKCKAVTYHKTDLTCAIGGSMTLVNDTSDQNYVTCERSKWPQVMDLASACRNHSCGPNERCVSLRSGIYHCIYNTMNYAQGLPKWTQFRNKYYWFEYELKNWTDAQSDCVARDGCLASLDTAAIHNFCYIAMSNRRIPKLWIAANDIASEGVWRWNVSGTPLVFHQWGPGAPSNRRPDSDCGILLDTGWWDNQECQEKSMYICEKPIA